MKILIINNAAFHEGEDGKPRIHNKNGDLGEELQSLGYQVGFFQQSLKNVGSVSTYAPEDHNMEVLKTYVTRSKLLTYIKTAFLGFKAIRKYDFIYLFYPCSLRFLMLFAILLRKEYGIYIRGSLGLYSRFSYFLYRHAKFVLCDTVYFTKRIKEHDPNIVIETSQPQMDVYEKDLYKREIKKKDFYKLLFVARLDLQKGPIELIDAINIMLKDSTLPGFHLNICGGGPAYNNIKERIEELNLTSHISLIGFLPDFQSVLNEYRQADIYVIPTHHDLFPRSLWEAMLSGDVCVTTMVGGIPGDMSDGENCLEIKPKSSQSIAEVLSRLLKEFETIAPKLVDGGYDTVLRKLRSTTPSHGKHMDKLLKM
jgi:glycosyltransferase involved in cell wall biosynthesis